MKKCPKCNKILNIILILGVIYLTYVLGWVYLYFAIGGWIVSQDFNRPIYSRPAYARKPAPINYLMGFLYMATWIIHVIYNIIFFATKIKVHPWEAVLSYLKSTFLPSQ